MLRKNSYTPLNFLQDIWYATAHGMTNGLIWKLFRSTLSKAKYHQFVINMGIMCGSNVVPNTVYKCLHMRFSPFTRRLQLIRINYNIIFTCIRDCSISKQDVTITFSSSNGIQVCYFIISCNLHIYYFNPYVRYDTKLEMDGPRLLLLLLL